MQARLLLAIQRTMSLSVGRGMLTLMSLRPIITQSIPVPTLNLTGHSKACSTNVVNLKEPLADALKTWPQFHNGVATALQLKPHVRSKDPTAWLASHRLYCVGLLNEV